MNIDDGDAGQGFLCTAAMTCGSESAEATIPIMGVLCPDTLRWL